MTIQTLLILLSLISSPSVSGAEQIHWQKHSLMQGQALLLYQADSGKLSENSEFIPQEIAKPSKPIKPLSPGFAFFLSSLPISSSLLVLGVESLTIVNEKRQADRELHFIPYYAFFAFTFLSIPGHIYVHDSFTKTSLITSGKIISLGLSVIGIMGLASTIDLCFENCDDDGHDDDDVLGFFSVIGIILGITGYIGTNIYELIDAPLAAKRYNRQIQQQQGFFVLPYAYKDQYRVNVGYRF